MPKWNWSISSTSFWRVTAILSLLSLAVVFCVIIYFFASALRPIPRAERQAMEATNNANMTHYANTVQFQENDQATQTAFTAPPSVINSTETSIDQPAPINTIVQLNDLLIWIEEVQLPPAFGVEIPEHPPVLILVSLLCAEPEQQPCPIMDSGSFELTGSQSIVYSRDRSVEETEPGLDEMILVDGGERASGWIGFAIEQDDTNFVLRIIDHGVSAYLRVQPG
jgi:hypothetical protein